MHYGKLWYDMRMSALTIAFLLAASAFGQGPNPEFDGATAPSRMELPPAPPSLNGAPVQIPQDLSQAKARLGTEAVLAQLKPRPDAETFVFGVIGDAEPGRFPWERIFSPGPDTFKNELESLQGMGPDFVIQLGDIVSEGNAANYGKAVKLLSAESGVPLLTVIGNHDRSRPNGDADKTFYDAVFGPRDYFFDHGGWRLICLDSSDRRLSKAQLDWLASALKTDKRKAVFTHVPPDYLESIKPLPEVGPMEIEPQAPIGDESTPAGDFFTGRFKEGAAEFDELVSNNGVAAVFMGHIHTFWAGDHRGVRYIISGGGGSPLYPMPPGYPKRRFAHFLSVEAGPQGLRETVHPMKGEAFVLPPVR